VDQLEIVGGLFNNALAYPIERHAGVNCIRKFYPDFVPTPEEWADAQWGSKPAPEKASA
jgi:hypothetical protein